MAARGGIGVDPVEVRSDVLEPVADEIAHCLLAVEPVVAGRVVEIGPVTAASAVDGHFLRAGHGDHVARAGHCRAGRSHPDLFVARRSGEHGRIVSGTGSKSDGRDVAAFELIGEAVDGYLILTACRELEEVVGVGPVDSNDAGRHVHQIGQSQIDCGGATADLEHKMFGLGCQPIEPLSAGRIA